MKLKKHYINFFFHYIHYGNLPLHYVDTILHDNYILFVPPQVSAIIDGCLISSFYNDTKERPISCNF